MNVFTIVSGSLKISDSNIVIMLIAKKDIGIITNELYQSVPRAVLYNLQRGYNEELLNTPLSNCSPDGINPFTVNSFLSFAEQNLGF